MTVVLFSDVAGFTRLMGRDQEGTLRRLKEIRRDIIDPTLEPKGGKIIKEIGDGLFIEFTSVIGAVRWAVETQRSLKEWNKNFRDDTRMDFRIGIHIGDSMVQPTGDLLGDRVNIGSRLEGIAEPGGICISEATFREVADNIDVEFVDLGEKQPKNVAKPIHVYGWLPEPKRTHETVSASPSPSDSPVKKPDRCFGRDEPVELLVAALTSGVDQVLYVLGPGGIGKTTVTRKAGAEPRVVQRFAHRRWYVELDAVLDAASLESKLVQAVGLNPAQTNFQQALAHLTRQTPCLLVLDNFETPWEADRASVEARLRALAAVPGLSLLSSLRGATAPDPQWTLEPVKLKPLDDEAAFQLVHTFAPSIAKTDPNLKPLLRDLGGIPLAIELIAKQAAAESALNEVWREWQRRGIEFASDRGVTSDRLRADPRS